MHFMPKFLAPPFALRRVIFCLRTEFAVEVNEGLVLVQENGMRISTHIVKDYKKTGVLTNKISSDNMKMQSVLGIECD